jgi:hypothetical protein
VFRTCSYARNTSTPDFEEGFLYSIGRKETLYL